VGITEQNDALALVVSETSGKISLAYGGKLRRDLTRLQLRQALKDLLETPANHKGNWIDTLVRFIKTQ
jgi:diadenylate cyclase